MLVLTSISMGRTAMSPLLVVLQPPSRIHATAATTTTVIITTIITAQSTLTTLWSSKETTTMFTSVDGPRCLILVTAIAPLAVVRLNRGMTIIDTITTTTITTGMGIRRAIAM